MKKWRVMMVMLLIALGTAFVGAQPPSRQLGFPTRPGPNAPLSQRVALVIGNAKYQHASELKNPVNDATDMAALLRELGFEVVFGTDQSLPQMRRLIREFGTKLQQTSGIGLFYYAGHGLQSGGRNFLLPVEADIASEVETEDAGLDVNAVLRQMEAAHNSFNIVVLDACRNNPFARSWNRDAGSGGLAQIKAPTGTFIAYATAPDSVASDGKGRNGLYTAELLNALRRPNLKLEEVFKEVRRAVAQTSQNKQVPWDSSSVTGDFYFNITVNIVTPSGPPPVGATTAVDDKALDLEFWQAIKDSNDPQEYRDYLEKFPNGQFAAIARRRAAGGRGGNGNPAPQNNPPPAIVKREEPAPPPVVAPPQPANPAPQAVPKSISAGVLNGKAVSLPKPVYPAIAMAARAGGTVSVQVTIDENGFVISANAISGHPLLQASAVKAAREARFSPTLLSGQPVKVTGVVIYNFIAPEPPKKAN